MQAIPAEDTIRPEMLVDLTPQKGKGYVGAIRATDETALVKLFHYTNLQALWAKDNLAKGMRYVSA